MQIKPYRFEFKYYLDNRVVEEIIEKVKKYLDKDKHFQYKDGSYDVTSLYFDSYRSTDYWEKTGGNIRRKKIRLRIYEPYLKNSEFVNFEIKHKIDMMNRKTKIRLSVAEAESFIKNGPSFFLKYDWKDNISEKEKILYYLNG